MLSFKILYLSPSSFQHPQHHVSDIGSGSEAFSIPVFNRLSVLLTEVAQLQMDYQWKWKSIQVLNPFSLRIGHLNNQKILSKTFCAACKKPQKRHKEYGFLSSILSISFCYKYPLRLHCSWHPVWRGCCSRQGSYNFVSVIVLFSQK